MSEYYIIPTTPDILSKIGISLVVDRIDNFKKERKDCNIDLLGIIFTKVDNRTNLHKNTKAELRNPANPFHTDVFKNELPLRISIAESPIDNRPHLSSTTAQQKNDWRETQDIIESITLEFLNKIP